MLLWNEMRSKPQQLAFINGIIPLILIIFFLFASTNYFFPPGYFLYAWLEILGLSTFVSIVPDVAHWFFFGIALVGAEATANLTITLLIVTGCLIILFGCFQSLKKKENVDEIQGRTAWLIGGVLSFPLGILSLIAYYVTRSKVQELSLKDRIIGELRKNKLPYLLIIPALVFLIFTYIVPILRGFYITLFSYPKDPGGGYSRAFRPVDYSVDPLLWTIHAILGGLQRQDPIFIGVDNYLELFSTTTNAISFQNALANNVYFVILFVPSVVIVSLGLAVLLNHKYLKGENTYTTIFYLPVVTSILVVSVIWLRVIFDPRGGFLTAFFVTFSGIVDLIYFILNIISLGLIPANTVGTYINWLTPTRQMEAVALMSTWRRVGFDVLILLAGLKSIPDSLYEAAEIDGHGSWSQFKNITLPMLKGPLGVVIILELIAGWQIFQELFGLNIAQFGGDQTLAIYLISNYSTPSIMTFASTVGYFIFGMTAFIGLIGRIEVRNVLKGFALFSLLAILFSIPSNRPLASSKSLGFTVSWLTYDLLFLVLTVLCLLYYISFTLLKHKQLEYDLHDLRTIGFFVLFVVPFYLLNGYNTITKSGAGTTPIWLIPSYLIGFILLLIALLMIFAYYTVPHIKERGLLPFLFFSEGDTTGV
ncbi:MAG: carbohydrate ABC transporter permease [Candidatus Thorarchaeota archaeon]